MDDFTQPKEILRALSYADLRTLGVPFSIRWLAQMERSGTFPRRYKLTNRRAAWDGEEVMAWLRSKRDANVPIAAAVGALQAPPPANRVNGAAKPANGAGRALVRRAWPVAAPIPRRVPTVAAPTVAPVVPRRPLNGGR